MSDALRENVRIDKGLKRGPRYKHRPPVKRDEQGKFLEAIPPDLDPDHVLELYLSRPTTSLIAKELGLRRSTLIHWIREQRPDQWKRVQVIRALLMKEDGGYEIAA